MQQVNLAKDFQLLLFEVKHSAFKDCLQALKINLPSKRETI